MRTEISRVFSFLLAVFSIFSSLNLAASIPEVERAKPLIRVATTVNDGILHVLLLPPAHLTTNENYFFLGKEGGKGLEGDFILTDLDSNNPRMISFSILAKNTDQGVDCIIDEIQIFEEQGWFSSSYSRKEASQLIHVQNIAVNMAENPKMHLVRSKNRTNTSAGVMFILMDKNLRS